MITFRRLSVIAAAASAAAIGIVVWRALMKLMEPDDPYSSGLDWVQSGPASGV
jgi:hypothetical protein